MVLNFLFFKVFQCDIIPPKKEIKPKNSNVFQLTNITLLLKFRKIIFSKNFYLLQSEIARLKLICFHFFVSHARKL